MIVYIMFSGVTAQVGCRKRVPRAEVTFSRHVLALLPPLQYFFWLVFHSNAYVNSPFIFLIAFPVFILTSLGKKFRHIQLSTDSGYLKNSIAVLYIVDMFFISSEPMLDRGDDSVHIA